MGGELDRIGGVGAKAISLVVEDRGLVDQDVLDSICIDEATLDDAWLWIGRDPANRENGHVGHRLMVARSRNSPTWG